MPRWPSESGAWPSDSAGCQAPLDLDIWAGEVLGCLGPTGAGKTTLSRLHGGLDARYQAELIELFQPDPLRKVGSYSTRSAAITRGIGSRSV
ncbi:MAG: ATP-binding cassette domain-containing protein [Jatrophihabitantaceae bacterium]